MTTDNLILRNPSTVQIDPEDPNKFAINPTEDGILDCPLALQTKGNFVKVSIAEDVHNIKPSSELKKIFEDTNFFHETHIANKYDFKFSTDALNTLFSEYTEDILEKIVEFLYEYSFVEENIFIEKLILLRRNNYPVEYVISALSSMKYTEVKEIMSSNDTLGTFRYYI